MINVIIITILLIGYVCYIAIIYSQLNSTNKTISSTQNIVDSEVQSLQDIKIMITQIYDKNHGLPIYDPTIEKQPDKIFGEILKDLPSQDQDTYLNNYVQQITFQNIGFGGTTQPTNILNEMDTTVLYKDSDSRMFSNNYTQYLLSVIRQDQTPINCSNPSTSISTYTQFTKNQKGYQKLPIGSILYMIFPLNSINSTDDLIEYGPYVLKYLQRNFQYTSQKNPSQPYNMNFSDNVLMGMGDNDFDKETYYNTIGCQFTNCIGSLIPISNDETITLEGYFRPNSQEKETLYINLTDSNQKYQNISIKSSLNFINQFLDLIISNDNAITGKIGAASFFDKTDNNNQPVKLTEIYSQSFKDILIKLIEDKIYNRNTFQQNLDSLERICSNMIVLNQSPKNHNHYNYKGQQIIEQVNELNGSDSNKQADLLYQDQQGYIFGNKTKFITYHGYHCFYDNYKAMDNPPDKTTLFNTNLFDYEMGLCKSFSTYASNNSAGGHDRILTQITKPNTNITIIGHYKNVDRQIDFATYPSTNKYPDELTGISGKQPNDTNYINGTDAGWMYNYVLQNGILKPTENIVNWDIKMQHGQANDTEVYYPLNIRDQYQSTYMYVIVSYNKKNYTNQWLYLNKNLISRSIYKDTETQYIVINDDTTQNQQIVSFKGGYINIPGLTPPYENYSDNNIYQKITQYGDLEGQNKQILYQKTNLFFRLKDGLLYSQQDVNNGIIS